MLRKCCCRPVQIAIVQAWSSLHRGLGPAWRAAWPRIRSELRSLPVRWTTAIDFAGMYHVGAMVSNWQAEVSVRAPFTLDDGRRVAPWGGGVQGVRGVQARQKAIDDCPPPDFASLPDAWGNLDTLSNTSLPYVTFPFGDSLFFSTAEEATWGRRAIVAFGGGVNRQGAWLRPANSQPLGAPPLPVRPPLDPPSVVDRTGFAAPEEQWTIQNAASARVHLFALNPAPALQGFDDSIRFGNGLVDPAGAPGYASRVTSATGGWASHDWGLFSDIPRLVDELRRIVAAVQSQRP